MTKAEREERNRKGKSSRSLSLFSFLFLLLSSPLSAFFLSLAIAFPSSFLPISPGSLTHFSSFFPFHFYFFFVLSSFLLFNHFCSPHPFTFLFSYSKNGFIVPFSTFVVGMIPPRLFFFFHFHFSLFYLLILTRLFTFTLFLVHRIFTFSLFHITSYDILNESHI